MEGPEVWRIEPLGYQGLEEGDIGRHWEGDIGDIQGHALNTARVDCASHTSLPTGFPAN